MPNRLDPAPKFGTPVVGLPDLIREEYVGLRRSDYQVRKIQGA
jgi:hypothetical protein